MTDGVVQLAGDTRAFLGDRRAGLTLLVGLEAFELGVIRLALRAARSDPRAKQEGGAERHDYIERGSPHAVHGVASDLVKNQHAGPGDGQHQQRAFQIAALHDGEERDQDREQADAVLRVPCRGVRDQPAEELRDEGADWPAATDGERGGLDQKQPDGQDVDVAEACVAPLEAHQCEQPGDDEQRGHSAVEHVGAVARGPSPEVDGRFHRWQP